MKQCRLCDNPDITVALEAIGPDGKSRYVCTDCWSNMEAMMQQAREQADCPNLHEEDGPGLADAVEEFFKK